MTALAGVMLLCAVHAACATEATDSATTLRERYTTLAESLRTSQFGRPLVLDSTETTNRLQGDIHAIVDYPIGKVSSSLGNPDNWCDLILLHINTKFCHATTGPSGTTLRVNIGSKKPDDLADSVGVDFNFHTAVATPDFVEVALDAKNGPMGSSDYRIRLEAVALSKATTFVHLTYSYTINLAGRLAMKSYLATVGSNKVGFTASGTQADGQIDYIGGVRGMVERNTMRYYLAIDSYLGAADIAPAGQLDFRLQSWFSAVERYPRQLHEMDRETYLAMKHAEHLRQQLAK